VFNSKRRLAVPKTQAPSKIKTAAAGTFVTDAVPDPFDERDLEYRPMLEPLPPSLDQRIKSARYVMKQQGNSCTGHALASVINTVLARPAKPTGDPSDSEDPAPASAEPPAPARVSPYMLYYLARRYDEFGGQRDEGSSLRGALKGWFHHGVVLESTWPKLTSRLAYRLDDDEVMSEARERPLGAFYRVNALRLDDMQSAISELNAICASAVVHDGWMKPEHMVRTGADGKEEEVFVIARKVDSQSLGGHAFAIVGYNEVGFLVHNSWGTAWGKGGFATLPYEDWLDSAYDAWVARPGVAKTPFASGKTGTGTTNFGGIGTVPGPNLRRLRAHVVNLENDGKLSSSGRFTSDIPQVHGIFEHMERWHDYWIDEKLTDRRRIVLYAHGGLVKEQTGLESAEGQLNWWLNNHVYPVFFAWQSGPVETLMSQLVDSMGGRLPFGGVWDDMIEQFDRGVERFVKDRLRWTWDQMKQNAVAASRPIPQNRNLNWPPNSRGESAVASLPGASLTVDRLAKYAGDKQVEVHLVGHSAGSIFHTALLERLLQRRIPVRTMALLAPAIRVDDFAKKVLPHIGNKAELEEFAVFGLRDHRELDDVCGAPRLNVYHKSLLYLVSRALERSNRVAEVPLLGMEKFFDLIQVGGMSLRKAITSRNGDCIFAPSIRNDDPNNSAGPEFVFRSDAKNHGDFDDDTDTMTSVVARILGVAEPGGETRFQRYAALNYEPSWERTAGRAPEVPESRLSTRLAQGPQGQPDSATVSAEPQAEQPEAPSQPHEPDLEVAEAPKSTSPVIDVMAATGGWRVA
jgi:pimeloyl-ACP methyl ester carboxylesterase